MSDPNRSPDYEELKNLEREARENGVGLFSSKAPTNKIRIVDIGKLNVTEIKAKS